MELSEAIDRIIQEFGKDIIAEKRFVYMISDYYSFRDNPAEKRVLSALVNDGYTARLLNLNEGLDISIVTNQIVSDVCKNYGFREDLLVDIISSIMRGLSIKYGYQTKHETYGNAKEFVRLHDKDNKNQ